ncbi:transposase [Eggerthellaceae bacterium zg-893]|nr:transposase [Eggerthellaceae bacterium zg-893]
MPRSARQHSISGMYHVTARGAGRRVIFEDDDDRALFVDKLKTVCLDRQVSILAWCLMDNHYHLLLKGELDAISSAMGRVNTSLAHRYNGKYGHVGPVLQNRFSSTPIEREAHFLEVVRYIHLNPKDRGDANFRDYAWSSYREYVGTRGICDTDFVLGVFGGKEQFVDFHDASDGAMHAPATKPVRSRVSDAEAREIAIAAFGDDFADKITAMSRVERNEALRRLNGASVSVRQLQRLTGIGRGVIQSAVKGTSER